MADLTQTPGLSPAARAVLEVIQGDGNNSAQGSSFGEPIPSYEPQSDRDEQIKEWGMCVGAAYALVAFDNPLRSLQALEEEAGTVAREAFFTLHPDLQPAGREG